MRKSLVYTLAALLVGLTGLMVPGEAAAPSQHLKFSLTRPQVRAISDITYAQYFDWPKSFLKMDILQPESKEKLPAVVFVTGGGFTASPKENYLQQRVHLAEHGYFVASVEYRVIPSGMFPDPVVDVKAALRYLRAHAQDFNIDPNRMAVMGESATWPLWWAPPMGTRLLTRGTIWTKAVTCRPPLISMGFRTLAR